METGDAAVNKTGFLIRQFYNLAGEKKYSKQANEWTSKIISDGGKSCEGSNMGWCNTEPQGEEITTWDWVIKGGLFVKVFKVVSQVINWARPSQAQKNSKCKGPKARTNLAWTQMRTRTHTYTHTKMRRYWKWLTKDIRLLKLMRNCIVDCPQKEYRDHLGNDNCCSSCRRWEWFGIGRPQWRRRRETVHFQSEVYERLIGCRNSKP